MTFAELVRANRQRLALTQKELAASAGLNVRTVRKIEAGRVGSPRAVTIRLLADAFALTGADRERFCQLAASEPARTRAAGRNAARHANGSDFRLLGPIEIEIAGQLLPLPRRRERCLLAILLLEMNRVVSVDRLAELLWDGDPPDRARRAVHSHISRLRAILSSTGAPQLLALATVGDGYRIDGDRQTVDAHRFRTLLSGARATTDLAERIDWQRAALDLWRGAPLDNAATEWLRDRLCSDLHELRLAAIEDLAAASLALRREREVLPELARISRTHPDRESLTGLHMRALYQAGRKADALAAYDRARSYLADTLGLDPARSLRELHTTILRDELTVPLAGLVIELSDQQRPAPRLERVLARRGTQDGHR